MKIEIRNIYMPYKYEYICQNIVPIIFEIKEPLAEIKD